MPISGAVATWTTGDAIRPTGVDGKQRMGLMRVLSWGKGVQSTTLAAMSAKGLLPRLDAIIFSDTGAERQRTYEVGDWYERWLKQQGLHVENIAGGDIIRDGVERHIHVPFWTSDGGPLRRECTWHFKIKPVRRRVRELSGYHPTHPPHPAAGSIEMWIGISWDEWRRMSHSRVRFITNRYPLVEMRMTRWDCIDWLESNGLPVPVKSACLVCPYRPASEWLEMRDECPVEFDQAVEFDERNRHNPLAIRAGSTADELFIFKDRRQPVPLADADLVAAAARERRDCQLPLLLV